MLISTFPFRRSKRERGKYCGTISLKYQIVWFFILFTLDHPLLIQPVTGRGNVEFGLF